MELQPDHFFDNATDHPFKLSIDDCPPHPSSLVKSNEHDGVCDFALPKSGGMTEKFILDLLSWPELSKAHPDAKQESSTVSVETPDKTASSAEDNEDFSITWGADSLDDAMDQGNAFELPIHASVDCAAVAPTRTSDSGGTTTHGAASQAEDMMIAQHMSQTSLCGKINKGTGNDTGKIGAGGSELRSRRRREFHKIHTRRSRAKLNEKMDLLKRVLPEPPSGMVVKSKAQIIDYAISVLRQLSLTQMQRTEGMQSPKVLA